MTKYYDLTIWYKHNINDGFIREHYSIIDEIILKSITERYEKYYRNGDYAALRFEYEIVQ